MQNENVKEDTNSILLPKNGKRKKFLKSFFHQKKVTSSRTSPSPSLSPSQLTPKTYPGDKFHPQSTRAQLSHVHYAHLIRPEPVRGINEGCGTTSKRSGEGNRTRYTREIFEIGREREREGQGEHEDDTGIERPTPGG